MFQHYKGLEADEGPSLKEESLLIKEGMTLMKERRKEGGKEGGREEETRAFTVICLLDVDMV